MNIVRLVADPYPPYQYEEGGTTKGLDYELIATAFTAGGMEATIQLLLWEDCMAAMAAQDADAIFQITRTPHREEKYVFSAPFRTALQLKRSCLVWWRRSTLASRNSEEKAATLRSSIVMP